MIIENTITLSFSSSQEKAPTTYPPTQRPNPTHPITHSHTRPPPHTHLINYTNPPMRFLNPFRHFVFAQMVRDIFQLELETVIMEVWRFRKRKHEATTNRYLSGQNSLEACGRLSAPVTIHFLYRKNKNICATVLTRTPDNICPIPIPDNICPSLPPQADSACTVLYYIVLIVNR